MELYKKYKFLFKIEINFKSEFNFWKIFKYIKINCISKINLNNFPKVKWITHLIAFFLSISCTVLSWLLYWQLMLYYSFPTITPWWHMYKNTFSFYQLFLLNILSNPFLFYVKYIILIPASKKPCIWNDFTLGLEGILTYNSSMFNKKQYYCMSL